MTEPITPPTPEPRFFDQLPPVQTDYGVELHVMPPNREGMHPTYQRQGVGPAAEVAGRLTPHIAAVMARGLNGFALRITIEYVPPPETMHVTMNLTAGPDAPASPSASSGPTSAPG